MNPDQTAPCEQSDLGPYCFQYSIPKKLGISFVVDGREKVKFTF